LLAFFHCSGFSPFPFFFSVVFPFGILVINQAGKKVKLFFAVFLFFNFSPLGRDLLGPPSGVIVLGYDIGFVIFYQKK